MEEALSSEGQEAKVRALLVPMFDEAVSHRGLFAFLAEEQLADALAMLEQEAEEEPAA